MQINMVFLLDNHWCSGLVLCLCGLYYFVVALIVRYRLCCRCTNIIHCKKIATTMIPNCSKSYFLVKSLKPFPISKGSSFLSKNSTFWNVPSDAMRRNEFKLPQSCNLRITQPSLVLKRGTVGFRSKILFCKNSVLNNVIREALSERRNICKE